MDGFSVNDPVKSAILDYLDEHKVDALPRKGVTSTDHAIVEYDHPLLLAQSHLSSSLRYAHHNVLAHKGQTFGVEIEVEGVSGDDIAHALFNAGLSTHMDQRPYHEFREQTGDWVVEEDTSVDGAEVISPVLQDTPATWEALARVCAILRDLGATTSPRTGFHVHVGTASSGIETDIAAFQRIGRLCSYGEDLLFRISGSTRDGDEIMHRGALTGYSWCTPVGNSAMESASPVNIESHKHTVATAKPALRLSSRFATLEYRYFDGTIDPLRMQHYIKLCCAITARSGEIDDTAIPDESHPLGEQYGRGTDESSNHEHVLAAFAAIVHPAPSDRRGLYALYARGSWQPNIPQAKDRMDAKCIRIRTAQEAVVTGLTALFKGMARRAPTPEECTWLEHVFMSSYMSPFPLPSSICDDVHTAFLKRKEAFLEKLDLQPSEREELSSTIEQRAVSYLGERAEWNEYAMLIEQFPHHVQRMPTPEECKWLRSHMRAVLIYSTPPSPDIAALFLRWSEHPLPDSHPQRSAWESNRSYRASIVRKHLERSTVTTTPAAIVTTHTLS